jgi:hypothetical protein
VWIVFGFLLNNGVNETWVYTLPLARAKDNQVEITVAGQRDISGYRFLKLCRGANNGCEYGTEKESSEIRQKKKQNNGKW